MIKRVRDLEQAHWYNFVSVDSDVAEIKSLLPPNVQADAAQFDSFFVWTRDGDFVSVWGMYGIFPALDRHIFKII